MNVITLHETLKLQRFRIKETSDKKAWRSAFWHLKRSQLGDSDLRLISTETVFERWANYDEHGPIYKTYLFEVEQKE
jgi:hypothetical protein